MYKNRERAIVVVIAAVALTGWLIAGCGGGGGGTDPAGAGSVSGATVDIVSRIGIDGLTVTVDGQQAVTDNNGNFTVTDVPPGTWAVVVTETTLWEQAGEAPFVVVVAGQTAAVGTILVRDPYFGPPGLPPIGD